MTPVRRAFLKGSAAAFAATALPRSVFAQAAAAASAPVRGVFAPQSSAWRTFDVKTRVDIRKPQGVTRVWLPLPSVNSDYQNSLDNSFSSNGASRLVTDGSDGAKMLMVEFEAAEAKPFVELTSRVQTRNRVTDWAQKSAPAEDADTLRYFTRATSLIPVDGLVRKTALGATQGATTDVEKTRKIYDWIVANTYREPKVRGCGEGDISAMLETGNLGGKCADLNALFVGMCRSVGVPGALGVWLQGTVRQLGQPQRCPALPCRSSPEGLWLGGDGPGRRRQGYAAGNCGLDQKHGRPCCGPGQQGAVWRLGRQLDGLQHGS
jgi:hypothetical protein